MKHIVSSITFLIGFIISQGQKPALNVNDLQNFSEKPYGIISNNGKYVFYQISDYKNSKSQLFIKSVDGKFERGYVINSASIGARFSEDSRHVLFLMPGDSLCVLNLETKQEQYITNCRSYQIPSDANSKWLACQLTNNIVILYNLTTGEKKLFDNADGYLLSAKGNVLLINHRSVPVKQ